jgi:hypothetical protein
MTFLRIVIALYLLFEHDLFGKPVPTFPDHASSVELVLPLEHADGESTANKSKKWFCRIIIMTLSQEAE